MLQCMLMIVAFNWLILGQSEFSTNQSQLNVLSQN